MALLFIFAKITTCIMRGKKWRDTNVGMKCSPRR